MDNDDYNYSLPEKNLALSPAVPRDASRLFVYDTENDEIIFERFINLDKYLPSNSFLILNDTKVLPARIEMKKETGGKVVVLILVNEIEGNIVPAIVDRRVNVGSKLFFANGDYLTVLSQNENIFYLKFSYKKEELFDYLSDYGSMPIPPYLKKTTLKRDELLEKYQTVFAREKGSSAAPTASLHFTDRVFEKLKLKEIEKYFITLHVGLGTFAPISKKNLTEGKLHEEYYEIPQSTVDRIKDLKDDGKKLVSVGTTVTRTLESYAKTGNLSGKTDLFIYPPYDYKMVDVMLTNFHLPRSSLMMLVEAFMKHKRAKKRLIDLYNMAIKENFRFYSFGDAMLIL